MRNLYTKKPDLHSIALSWNSKPINDYALVSLEEGLEETLPLQCLDLFPQLNISLKATNWIESVMALLKECNAKVNYRESP